MKPGDANALPPTESARPPLADWQIERVQSGLADMRAGRVQPAGKVLAEIAAKYGWTRL